MFELIYFVLTLCPFLWPLYKYVFSHLFTSITEKRIIGFVFVGSIGNHHLPNRIIIQPYDVGIRPDDESLFFLHT